MRSRAAFDRALFVSLGVIIAVMGAMYFSEISSRREPLDIKAERLVEQVLQEVEAEAE